ncbi:MAG: tetratricopeptide repeat protein [Pseudomonadales bacterium]|nr:tetratricopeptide repeat protein [Pseudomonadales bacterium]
MNYTLAVACYLIALACLLLLTACGTTSGPATQTHITVDKKVGFTITEEARISTSVRADYEEAITMLETERYDAGIELLEGIVERAPELSAPRIDLGIAHHRAGNLTAAEKHLREALASNPEHPVGLNELGIVYRKLGRFEEARTSYQAALSVYPGYHLARRNLAVLCDLYLSDLSCALDHYEAYMATVQEDEEVTIWIADIRQRMARGEQP